MYIPKTENTHALILDFDTSLSNHFTENIGFSGVLRTIQNFSFKHAYELTKIIYVDIFKITCILRESLSGKVNKNMWNLSYFVTIIH